MSADLAAVYQVWEAVRTAETVIDKLEDKLHEAEWNRVFVKSCALIGWSMSCDKRQKIEKKVTLIFRRMGSRENSRDCDWQAGR